MRRFREVGQLRLSKITASKFNVDGAQQNADVAAHRVVGDEQDHRDRREDQRVLSHRLTARSLTSLDKHVRGKVLHYLLDPC